MVFVDNAEILLLLVLSLSHELIATVNWRRIESLLIMQKYYILLLILLFVI